MISKKPGRKAWIWPGVVGGRRQYAGQAVQQGGLARAARAHDREDFPSSRREGGAAQGGRLAKRLHDAPRLDDRLRILALGGH
jgi:hypothetical protein